MLRDQADPPEDLKKPHFSKTEEVQTQETYRSSKIDSKGKNASTLFVEPLKDYGFLIFDEEPIKLDENFISRIYSGLYAFFNEIQNYAKVSFWKNHTKNPIQMNKIYSTTLYSNTIVRTIEGASIQTYLASQTVGLNLDGSRYQPGSTSTPRLL